MLKISVIAIERPPEIELQQPGVNLELVAENPDLATTTEVDVDGEGGIWVVTCNSYMPPEDYGGRL